IEIVRLISSGTSASVTAAPAYLSGGSIFKGVMGGIALAADASAIQRFDVLSGGPLAAEGGAVSREDTSFPAAGADEQFLIGRRIQPVPFDDCPPLLEQRAAFPADQHGVSPSSKATYYPQSQPLPSRNSRQGHLLSGFRSSLQGQKP